jgi:hypothetical protein
LVECLCGLVVVGVVGVVLAGVVEGDVLPDLPPHPATVTVAAAVASSVSMATSGARFICWTPILT